MKSVTSDPGQHGGRGRRGVTRLTFGPPQHEAEAFAVFLLQQHRLLLDYVVAGREGRRRQTRDRQTAASSSTASVATAQRNKTGAVRAFIRQRCL